MKKYILFTFLILPLILQAQVRQVRSITISLDKSRATYFGERKIFEPIVDSAFKIASAILSTKEFQDEIGNMSFDCQSFCEGCNQIKRINGRIPGDVVLNSLFRETKVLMGFTLKEDDGPLGETSADADSTTAWYGPIKRDMPEIKSFAYALAINLCHEYMHQVGYCHTYCTEKRCHHIPKLNEVNGQPDPRFINQDVTYRVGWAAYYILLKCQEDGRDPFKLK